MKDEGSEQGRKLRMKRKLGVYFSGRLEKPWKRWFT